MKSPETRYRVAVVGASSLLGKEILAVLEERQFPIARLIRYEGDVQEPDLPIVDLRDETESVLADNGLTLDDLDFVFLAACPAELPPFLRGPAPDASSPAARCVVIDSCGVLPESVAWPRRPALRIPATERRPHGKIAPRESNRFASAHPATIVLSTLLLRVAARFALKHAVAQIFLPASEIGPRAIEELQKQTVNLLSFQKIPRAVFGAQLAFNLLPRFGSASREAFGRFEERIRSELQEYLRDRAPLPALRVLQVPVFYALACSLYVETAEKVAPEALGAALAGRPVRIRRLSEPVPSQAEASGSGDILVDAIAPDPGQPEGLWIWAAVDNIRLAAVNAVEIAETLRVRFAPSSS